MHLFTCQPHFEKFLIRELSPYGLSFLAQGPGWITAEGPLPETSRLSELCFTHSLFHAATVINAAGVKASVDALIDYFMQSARQERFDAPWPMRFDHAIVEGLSKRTASVATSWLQTLRARMSRVAKLAVEGSSQKLTNSHGFWVFLTQFDTLIVTRDCINFGQCRMKDDPAAPSRSYLKIEEAFAVMGKRPDAGHRVFDLGAAPGGWSYSAAKGGAYVVAIDNGPLKGAAEGHALIEHRREDAFTFNLDGNRQRNWLLCDMVEDPYRILDLVKDRITNQKCAFFVVNFKFGKTDPVALLHRVRSALAPHCSRLIIRHLFHDREEFTAMGEVGLP